MRAGMRFLGSGHPPLHFDLSTFDIYGTLAEFELLFGGAERCEVDVAPRGDRDALLRRLAIGLGREGGHYSFEFYCELQAVHIALGEHRIPRLGLGDGER